MVRKPHGTPERHGGGKAGADEAAAAAAAAGIGAGADEDPDAAADVDADSVDGDCSSHANAKACMSSELMSTSTVEEDDDEDETVTATVFPEHNTGSVAAAEEVQAIDTAEVSVLRWSSVTLVPTGTGEGTGTGRVGCRLTDGRRWLEDSCVVESITLSSDDGTAKKLEDAVLVGGGIAQFEPAVVPKGDLGRKSGNEGFGASVCLLLPVPVDEVMPVVVLMGAARLLVVGIPKTRFSLVHSSSLICGNVHCVIELVVVVHEVEVDEAGGDNVGQDGLDDARGASRAFAALGGKTESFAFSSRFASIGASGR